MLFDKIKIILKNKYPLEYDKFLRYMEFDIEASTSYNIVIAVPNIYIANYINRKFKKQILELYEQETDIKAKLEIVVRNLTKNQKKESNYEIPEKETETKTVESSILIPYYTFENFVVGPSNQFAYYTAQYISKYPGKYYNPLFIYGNVGLGKTHLLHAIGNSLKNKLKVVYVTSEQFMNEFINHVRNYTMEKFHEKYRNCDVLLIDDIQFFEEKERTQEEFFHTFNELYRFQKQICLTADRPPKKLYNLVDRLRNRFEAGLIVDIQPPELQTKIEIIRKKCQINKVNISDEIIKFIATNFENNIREIEGVIIKLHAYQKILGLKEIDLDIIKQVLKDHLKEQQKNITLEKIIIFVSKEFNIKPSEIISKTRNKKIVKARRTAIYLARELTTESTNKIAKYFGLKDQSSVTHAIKDFNNKIKKDKDLQTLIEEMKNKILRTN